MANMTRIDNEAVAKFFKSSSYRAKTLDEVIKQMGVRLSKNINEGKNQVFKWIDGGNDRGGVFRLKYGTRVIGSYLIEAHTEAEAKRAALDFCANMANGKVAEADKVEVTKAMKVLKARLADARAKRATASVAAAKTGAEAVAKAVS